MKTKNILQKAFFVLCVCQKCPYRSPLWVIHEWWNTLLINILRVRARERRQARRDATLDGGNRAR